MAKVMESKTALILRWVTVYLMIVGVVSFPLFIFQESNQTVMFGTWAGKNAQDWHLVMEAHDIIERNNKTMKIINKYCAWIQPLTLLSYDACITGYDYYIKTLKAEAFAHAPALFLDKEVEFDMIIKDWEAEGLFYIIKANGIEIYVDDMPDTGNMSTLHVKGMLRQNLGGWLYIDLRSDELLDELESYRLEDLNHEPDRATEDIDQARESGEAIEIEWQEMQKSEQGEQ